MVILLKKQDGPGIRLMTEKRRLLFPGLGKPVPFDNEVQRKSPAFVSVMGKLAALLKSCEKMGFGPELAIWPKLCCGLKSCAGTGEGNKRGLTRLLTRLLLVFNSLGHSLTAPALPY
jgi:hypothetical protein